MANATVLNIGQVNGSGATDALFEKVFLGEVLTAFATANVTGDKHMVRTISHGKSASFPATWKVGAQYHTPGTEILGQTSNVAERIINIDGLLLAPVFIPLIDEAKNHFDYRSIYSKECGIALGTQWDKFVLQVMALTARQSATVQGAYGGTQLVSSGTLYKTSASDLVAGVYAALQAMDEKDIPESSVKNVFIKPAQYYMLTQFKDLIDTDFNSNNGTLSGGGVRMIGGARLCKTNNLPTTNIAASGTVPAAYAGDFSKTAAVVTTEQAVGTVKLLDLSMDMQWDIRRQGTLIVAKYAMGSGTTRPECAVELTTTA